MRKHAAILFLLLCLAALSGAAAGGQAGAPSNPPAAPPPAEVARLSLALAGGELVDFRLDAARGRAYVADSAGSLHVVDTGTLKSLGSWPEMGVRLALDRPRGRLYLSGLYDSRGLPQPVQAFDLEALAPLGPLGPGDTVAVDEAGGRLFVGDIYSYYTDSAQLGAPGVRIYDAATLEQTGEISRPGAPVWNPARGELLIVAYTVYSADPDSGEVTGDLLPELTRGLPFLWCNGCPWAERAYVFPDEQVIAVDVQGHSPQGAGLVSAPRLFDAATLAPLEGDAYTVQEGCDTQPALLGPVAGRRWRSWVYARYVVMQNFGALEGRFPAARRDGVSGFVNPLTAQAYLTNGYVLALPGLGYAGRWQPGCVFALDGASGRLYVRPADAPGALLVYDTVGAQHAVPVLEDAPTRAGLLPARSVAQLAPSPAYAADATLFAVLSDGGVYRSADRTRSWRRLAGGLPAPHGQSMRIALSPAFAADDTLFVAGLNGYPTGYGVLRSADRGDTWQPVVDGLADWRVTDLRVSRDFAADRSLAAVASYNHLAPSESGVSLWLSADAGASWRRVATDTVASSLPLTDVVAAPPAPPVRAADYGRAVEVRRGRGWQPAALALGEDERVLQTLAAADALYVLTNETLHRSTDGGATWAAWRDPRLAGRDYASALTTAALADAPGPGHTLFAGTAAGEVWALDPAQMRWEGAAPAALPTAAPPTAAPPAPPPTAAPPTPDPYGGAAPPGLHRPTGSLGERWAADPALRELLGWLADPVPATAPGAVQRFENGLMLWRGDTRDILVLYSGGGGDGWDAYADAYADGQPADDPAPAPPPGKQQPRRGFGLVWREQPGVRDALGWATGPEQPVTFTIYTFERGVVLLAGADAYVLGSTPGGLRLWR